jgi:hypothetical protein
MNKLLDKVNKLADTAKHRVEKRPRTYADEILSLPMNQQQQAIEQLPTPELREIIRFYVSDHHAKLDGLVRMVLDQPNREARNKALDRVPPSVRQVVRNRVIDVFKEKP